MNVVLHMCVLIYIACYHHVDPLAFEGLPQQGVSLQSTYTVDWLGSSLDAMQN